MPKNPSCDESDLDWLCFEINAAKMWTNLVCYEQDLRLCFEFGIELLSRGFMQYLACIL